MLLLFWHFRRLDALNELTELLFRNIHPTSCNTSMVASAEPEIISISTPNKNLIVRPPYCISPTAA